MQQRSRTYQVKATLQFNDGILKGSVKVKASNEEQARLKATARLVELWDCKALVHIAITGVV